MGKGSKSRSRDIEIEEPRTLMEDKPKTVIQPSKFFGEPGEDVEKWLKSFERVARANGWTEKRQCEILPAFLMDRAAEFFDELPNEKQNDFELLKQSLIEHFIPKEARRFFYADLYSRKQGETESAEDFGREVQLLVRRAHAEMPVEHQDTLMREHFVNGLRPALKRIVLISDPKTFLRALEVAKREKINDQVSNGSSPWVKTYSSMQPTHALPLTPVAAVSADQKINDRIDRLENVVEKLTIAIAESQSQRTIASQAQGYCRRYPRSDDKFLRTMDGRPICNYCKRVD